MCGTAFSLSLFCPAVHCCRCLVLVELQADEIPFNLCHVVVSIFFERAQHVTNYSSGNLGYREGRRIP